MRLLQELPAPVQVFFQMALMSLLYHNVQGRDHQTVFVIFGGTGDLATKYLWQGLFNVYYEHHGTHKQTQRPINNQTFSFFSVGRTNHDQGSIMLNGILASHISCDEVVDNFQNCLERKKEMSNLVKYLSVQTVDEFKSLCFEIESKLNKSMEINEVILYMAISPSMYESVLSNFYTTCKSKHDLDIKWKIALEKPFGVDKLSSESVAQSMLTFFKEEEIYRVDHYLGKPVVQAILPFR